MSLLEAGLCVEVIVKSQKKPKNKAKLFAALSVVYESKNYQQDN